MYIFIVKKTGLFEGEFFDFGITERLEFESMDELVTVLGGTKDDYKYNAPKKRIIKIVPPDSVGRSVELEIEVKEIPSINTNIFGLEVAT